MPDVAIIGAGPVGCVTALSFARRGADVLLLESQAEPGKRLAGEWLHPPAVHVLQNLGVEASSPEAGAPHPPGKGFVVFPDDGSSPIVLRYPGGETSLTGHHHALVAALRDTAAHHPRIEFRSAVHVHSIDGQQLTFAAGSSRSAGLIVGADGRSSFVRRCLGLDDGRVLLSHMAGVVLEDATLPYEEYGHVFLGGPGPMFVLRISPRHIRMCIDVPLAQRSRLADPEQMEAGYGPALPEALRPAFRDALQQRPVSWAANQWRPRLHYGRDGLALVVDAVGHFHPLTAVGMTLGFLDGHCLAQSAHLADYRRQRVDHSRVAELLAVGLHRVFTSHDEGSVALRQAVYRMWRQSAADRSATMKLLSGQSTQPAHFNRAFLKVAAIAVQDVLHSTLRYRHWQRTARTFIDLGGWLTWLAAPRAG